MINENTGNEEQQDSNLNSKTVAEVPAKPTVIPLPQSIATPQEVGTQPSTQTGQGNPPHPPQHLPPGVAQNPERSNDPDEALEINRNMLKATKGLVRATAYGIGLGCITALIFYFQFRAMTDQTQILSNQAITGVADSISADILTQKQIKALQDQVGASKETVAAIQRQMRQDQRAWMSVSFGETKFTEGQPILIPVTIVNTGKTAAKKYLISLVVQRIENTESAGRAIKLRYDVPSFRGSAGFVLPNTPTNMTAETMEKSADNRGAQPWNMDHESMVRLVDGRDFVIVYAEIRYRDIFGTAHWTKTCHFSSPSGKPVFAKKCTDYNDVDDN